MFFLSYTNNTPAAKLERRVQVGLPYPNSTRFEGFYYVNDNSRVAVGAEGMSQTLMAALRMSIL